MNITDPKFFQAGHAIFTVDNGKGQHYTYKIVQPTPEKPFFVSMLTGPDNNSDYTYLGIYRPQEHFLVLTAKSRCTAASTPVQVFQWALKAVVEQRVLPQGYSIHHEGRCCRCGRRLTTIESIEAGIGPECSRMINGEL